MQSSSIPSKFNIPFANNAGGPYIRTIPQASQVGITPGAASLYDGFPLLTFTPESSGGVPPSGQDFNGILNAITKWVQWLNAGAPVFYDATFSTAIGGYPKGAMIAAAAANTWWLSSVENNATNPDAGGAGWVQVVPAAPATVAPLINGTAAVGTSLAFARQDHVHPTDTSRAALSYVNSTFQTIAAAAATYLTKLNPTSSGTLIHTGGDANFVDISADRGNNTGVIFLGGSRVRYLYFDGFNYVMPGTELYVNGQPVVAGINTAYQTGINAGNAAAAAQNTATNAGNAATGAQNTANAALARDIGVGQSYQNVVSIRALNTNYTNTTGRPILVCCSVVSVNSSRSAYGIVDGATAAEFTAVSNASVGQNTFIVPSGSTYQLQSSGFLNLTQWYELR